MPWFLSGFTDQTIEDPRNSIFASEFRRWQPEAMLWSLAVILLHSFIVNLYCQLSGSRNIVRELGLGGCHSKPFAWVQKIWHISETNITSKHVSVGFSFVYFLCQFTSRPIERSSVQTLHPQSKLSLPRPLCSASFLSIPRCTAEARPKWCYLPCNHSRQAVPVFRILRPYDFLSWSSHVSWRLSRSPVTVTDFIRVFQDASSSIWVLLCFTSSPNTGS